MREEYLRLTTPEGLELCPCCGAQPELWEYQPVQDGPATKVVMCATGEAIGPQAGMVNGGCPLYMPNDDHYRATIREAVKFWNDFAKALTALQRKNRWEHAKVLRATPAAPSGEASHSDTNQQPSDPLQGAADWLRKAIFDCGVGDIQRNLLIGYNRAKRLFDAARLPGDGDKGEAAS